MTLNDTQFAHALGRIRSQEARMLNENEIERMIGVSDVKEAFKILNETGYSNHTLDIDKMDQFQEVIDAELLETAVMLKKISPQSEFLNILWYFYDIHNIKTLLKGKVEKIWEEDLDKLLSSLGSLDLEKLKAYFRTEGTSFPDTEFEGHTERFVETIRLVETTYAKDEDFQIIDLILDKLYLELALDIAIRSRDQFLTEFAVKNIDLFNIGSLFRMKLKNTEPEEIKKVFAAGGLLDKFELSVLAGKSITEIPNGLKETHYKAIGQRIAEECETSKTIATLEELTKNHVTDFIRTAKSVTYGIAPLIAFFWAKNNTAQIIRLILLSKISKIDPEIIRKHIRKLY
ncbi:hypothetical protein HOG48_06525 [Candidatus Peregrinibacteria bacterium]|jgi:V/A-type H+/Na+-transporting ATPase subunit C|nr:hypothetical protein [Candidatus Peregrinibacteria bacterium]